MHKLLLFSITSHISLLNNMIINTHTCRNLLSMHITGGFFDHTNSLHPHVYRIRFYWVFTFSLGITGCCRGCMNVHPWILGKGSLVTGIYLHPKLRSCVVSFQVYGGSCPRRVFDVGSHLWPYYICIIVPCKWTMHNTLIRCLRRRSSPRSCVGIGPKLNDLCALC